MEDNRKIIAVLNELIKINTDRIIGYEKATASLDGSEVMLKSLFNQVSDESREIKECLIKKVMALGGDPTHGTTIAGKIYHEWMGIKASLSGNESTSLIKACQFGEDAAQLVYKEAVADSKYFPDEIRNMIKNQQHLLKMSYDFLKIMRFHIKQNTNSMVS
jgi:uncharacterized protein (TIGR02284 family)